MIRLTQHATEMIEDRKIAEAWLEATIRMPDWTEPEPRDPAVTRSFRMFAELGDRVLKVVHRREDADILVITAYFDRDAKR
jgi:hypothetical protein